MLFGKMLLDEMERSNIQNTVMIGRIIVEKDGKAGGTDLQLEVTA